VLQRRWFPSFPCGTVRGAGALRCALVWSCPSSDIRNLMCTNCGVRALLLRRSMPRFLSRACEPFKLAGWSCGPPRRPIFLRKDPRAACPRTQRSGCCLSNTRARQNGRFRGARIFVRTQCLRIPVHSKKTPRSLLRLPTVQRIKRKQNSTCLPAKRGFISA
jgi:hypothetical protein